MLHNPANIQRTQSPSLTIRSANTAEVVRKPVGGSGGIDMASNMTAQDNNSPKNGIRYQFDQSPSASVRNSYVDNPAMDPQVRLEEYDWEELEEQFSKRMEAFKAVEENIWQEWRDWGEVRRFCPPHSPPSPRSWMIADELDLHRSLKLGRRPSLCMMRIELRNG